MFLFTFKFKIRDPLTVEKMLARKTVPQDNFLIEVKKRIVGGRGGAYTRAATDTAVTASLGWEKERLD